MYTSRKRERDVGDDEGSDGIILSSRSIDLEGERKKRNDREVGGRDTQLPGAS
jgi:hypothetical protein